MIDPKALDALYATLGDIQAANQPVEIIEEQQKAPPQKDALVEELLAQNTEELSDMYETMMAGAGEFGTGEYKGPTKKQLGLTPKVIVDEGPQDFMVKEEVITPNVLKQQVDLEQELEKLPQIKPEPVVAEQSQPVESLGTAIVVAPPEETLKDKEQPKAEEKAEDKKQPKGFTFDDTFTNYFKGAEGYLKEYNLAGEYKQKIKDKSAEEIAKIKKTYDIGYGHKLTDEEFKTGIVYGIKVRDDKGNKIALTDEQANFILRKDIESKAQDTVRDYKNVTGKNFLDLDKNLQNVLVDSAFNGVPIRDTKGLKKALKDNNVFNIIKNLTDRTTYSAEVKGNVYLGDRNKRLWNSYLDKYAKNNLSEELYEKAKKLVLETHQGPTPTTKRKMAQLR
jgi:hypothetical protein